MLGIFSYTDPLKYCNVQLRFMSVVNSWDGVGDRMGENGILAEILENIQRFTQSVSKIQNFKLTAMKI
jgi:hypothetical protein